MPVYIRIEKCQIASIAYNMFLLTINQEHFSKPQDSFNEIILDGCIAFYQINIHFFML